MATQDSRRRLLARGTSLSVMGGLLGSPDVSLTSGKKKPKKKKPCQAGLLPCKVKKGKKKRTLCVDASTDRTNCGGCGVTCASGQSCVQGTCQNATTSTTTSTTTPAPCAEGTTRCYGTCIPSSATCCVPDGATLRAELKAGGPETITLCPNTTYVGQFSTNRDVTLVGAGADSTVLDGNAASSVVAVGAGANVALRKLRITNGRGNLGGGIYSVGTKVTLEEVKVSENRSSYDGAGIWAFGNLLLINSDVTDNACGGDFTVGYGGGIHAQGGEVILRRSRVLRNSAISGGGIRTRAAVGPVGGHVTLEDGSEVSSNSASFGGGVQLYEGGSLTLKAGTSVKNNSANLGAGIDNINGTVVLHEDAVVSDNEGVSFGGGINNEGILTLKSGSRVEFNSATYGGGIYTKHTLTLETGSCVSNNAASDQGGGIANSGTAVLEADSQVSENTGANGGGFFHSGGTATFKTGSRVTNNRASQGGGVSSPYGPVTLDIDTIVTGNFLLDGTTPSNCAPVNTIPNCVG